MFLSGPHYGRNESKRRRREIVDKLREEGKLARREGKSYSSNPHKFMNAHQWWTGWLVEDCNIRSEENNED
jgi:hypothetical protein